MNCEKCKFYWKPIIVYTFGKLQARCLFGGCDGSQYEPIEEGEQNE